jgi:hypothetical protein
MMLLAQTYIMAYALIILLVLLALLAICIPRRRAIFRKREFRKITPPRPPVAP